MIMGKDACGQSSAKAKIGVVYGPTISICTVDSWFEARLESPREGMSANECAQNTQLPQRLADETAASNGAELQ